MDDLTYIMSTPIKFHEYVLLCLGAMIILVSMGDTKIIKITIFSSINVFIAGKNPKNPNNVRNKISNNFC